MFYFFLQWFCRLRWWRKCLLCGESFIVFGYLFDFTVTSVVPR